MLVFFSFKFNETVEVGCSFIQNTRSYNRRSEMERERENKLNAGTQLVINLAKLIRRRRERTFKILDFGSFCYANTHYIWYASRCTGIKRNTLETLWLWMSYLKILCSFHRWFLLIRVLFCSCCARLWCNRSLFYFICWRFFLALVYRRQTTSYCLLVYVCDCVFGQFTTIFMAAIKNWCTFTGIRTLFSRAPDPKSFSFWSQVSFWLPFSNCNLF